MKPVTEAEFMRQVIQLAYLRGWRVAHFRPGRVLKKDGSTTWRTPVGADGAGFPDLLLIRPRDGRILAAELKVGRNQATPEQVAWLDAFRAAYIPAMIWRPTMWPEIEEALE